MMVATAMPSEAIAVIESRMPTLSARWVGAKTPSDAFTPQACQTTDRSGTHRPSSLVPGRRDRTAVAAWRPGADDRARCDSPARHADTAGRFEAILVRPRPAQHAAADRASVR